MKYAEAAEGLHRLFTDLGWNFEKLSPIDVRKELAALPSALRESVMHWQIRMAIYELNTNPARAQSLATLLSQVSDDPWHLRLLSIFLNKDFDLLLNLSSESPQTAGMATLIGESLTLRNLLTQPKANTMLKLVTASATDSLQKSFLQLRYAQSIALRSSLGVSDPTSEDEFLQGVASNRAIVATLRRSRF